MRMLLMVLAIFLLFGNSIDMFGVSMAHELVMEMIHSWSGSKLGRPIVDPLNDH